ncbi:MBG domain-containing protein [Flavobacterium sp. Arc2]|uniref:MBG domain-containing protein n=1 Tax=Flavobacterium sp. Arc2 TaxID=3046685 RepID=UPI00352E07AC
MKQFYKSAYLLAFLSVFCCFSLPVFAQVTSPVAQTLPYLQNFGDLTSTSTTYPPGFQGWSTNSYPGASYNTSASLAADKPLTANSTASTTSGNIHNYNGKIGFLNTGSLDLTIAFAFSTSDKYGIELKYDAMVIRNPYDGNSNNRISEMIVQYRIGNDTPFTSLLQTAYLNDGTKQVTGTSGLNSTPIKVILPAECNNQPLVQIRWISKQNSGAGSRPSFAIDNISIKNDTAPPVNDTDYPKISNILSNDFDFSTKINETGKTYFVLLPSGSAKPSASEIKAGHDANGTPALQSGVLNITDESLVYTITISDLILGTNYSLFSISEDNYGNQQADSNQIDVKTSNTPVPSLVTTTKTLDFNFTEQNFDSQLLSYKVQGTNLNTSVTLTTTTNFSLSKSADGTFQSSISFAKEDFDNENKPTVYVRFSPTTTGDFTGEIAHQSTGASNKKIALSGTGINPYFQNFNDVNVLSNSGWTSYSVAGDKIKWESTSVKFNSSPAAVQINGYAESGPSKDWLISPNLRLDNFNKFPLVSFYSRKYYEGTVLKLMVSTNYDGKSSPETATWTTLDGDFPTTTAVFKQSQYINLEAYKTNHTYIAWVYETPTNGGNNAAEWTVDDVSITNESTFLASNPNLNFGEINPNATSESQSFVFMAGGYGDITISAPQDYQISTDNATFKSQVVVAAAAAIAGKTLYARFSPSVKALNITGALSILGTGLDQKIGFFTGSSLPKTETFDIVSYNLEFFGSDIIGSTGTEFGPIDDALQVENVAKVMNKLNADVYAVQEVSDMASLDNLIQKISVNGKTFDKVISPVWSYSFNPPSADFPDQKLVVIYNTQTAKVKSTKVLLNTLYNDIRAGKTTLSNYPGGNSQSFFSSGRLPYLVTLETNIAGVKKEINIIDIHARANSGADISKYNMRKYDAEVLKDSLDAQYPDANFMILGDYNDDVSTSVIAGNPSSYQKIVEDTDRYNALTLELSKAGAYSYLSSGGFLDHIIISNELTKDYVPNSIAVYDPRVDISNYVNTTSDHGPVIARFDLKKAEQTVSFSAIDSKTYGAPSFDLSSSSTSNLDITYSSSDETVAKVTNGKIQIIGSGTVSITASQSGNEYYLAAVDANQSFTINKAALTVKADDKTKFYKEENPTLTAAYNGFVYQDNITSVSKLAVLSTTANTNSIVGSYPITADLAEAKNYTFTYSAGTLTVQKENQSPIVEQTISNQSLIVPDQKNINLLEVFSDPDLDVLTYEVTNENSTVAEVTINASTLTILSKATGGTLVTVIARDGKGGMISTSFSVNVSTVLSITDQELKAFSVKTYPNPAKEETYVSIRTDSPKDIELRLYSVSGKMIGNPLEIKGTLSENITRLELSNLQSGIYFYTLSVDNKIVFKEKIVKK